MARFMHRKRRKPATIPEITLTPLIDTALVLLLIFMVTTPMIQNSIKVQLPQGQAKETKDATEEIVLHIDKDGTLYLNGKVIQRDRVVAELKRVMGRSSQKVVFVKADERVAWKAVAEIVDHIKVTGGIQYVALATQKRA